MRQKVDRPRRQNKAETQSWGASGTAIPNTPGWWREMLQMINQEGQDLTSSARTAAGTFTLRKKSTAVLKSSGKKEFRPANPDETVSVLCPNHRAKLFLYGSLGSGPKAGGLMRRFDAAS